jgi:hypothetical protein
MICTHRDYEQSWMFVENIPQNQFQMQYIRSFYFVTTTLSTCGYGDITPNHADWIETFTNTLLIFSGMLFYSYTIEKIQQMIINDTITPNDFQ